MPQVLNLEVKSNDTLIANVYYRWSGYTNDSIELLKKILHDLVIAKQKTQYDSVSNIILRRIVSALHKTGAKFDNNILSHIDTLNLDDETICFISHQISSYVSPADSSNGLISLTSEQMSVTDENAQFTVTINYEDLTVELGTLDFYENMEEIQDSYDMDDEDLQTIPLHHRDIDTFNMTFDHILDLEQAIALAEQHPFTCFKTPDGSYYSAVES